MLHAHKQPGHLQGEIEMGKLNRLLGNAVLSAVLLSVCSASAGDITGAGATFPYPVYAKWTEAYKAQTGTGMNYQAIGSGNGINQIQAKTVDFGATDKELESGDVIIVQRSFF